MVFIFFCRMVGGREFFLISYGVKGVRIETRGGELEKRWTDYLKEVDRIMCKFLGVEK